MIYGTWSTEEAMSLLGRSELKGEDSDKAEPIFSQPGPLINFKTHFDVKALKAKLTNFSFKNNIDLEACYMRMRKMRE